MRTRELGSASRRPIGAPKIARTGAPINPLRAASVAWLLRRDFRHLRAGTRRCRGRPMLSSCCDAPSAPSSCSSRPLPPRARSTRSTARRGPEEGRARSGTSASARTGSRTATEPRPVVSKGSRASGAIRADGAPARRPVPARSGSSAARPGSPGRASPASRRRSDHLASPRTPPREGSAWTIGGGSEDQGG